LRVARVSLGASPISLAILLGESLASEMDDRWVVRWLIPLMDDDSADGF
jgi:hypothetical protein